MQSTRLLEVGIGAGAGSGVDVARAPAVDSVPRELGTRVDVPRSAPWAGSGAERVAMLDERVVGDVVLSGGGGAAEFVLPAAPAEVVDLIFVDAGELTIEAGGHLPDAGVGAVARAGMLVVAPGWLAARGHVRGPWSMLTIRIGRAAVEAFAPRLPDDVGVFATRSALERAVRTFVFELLRTGAAAQSQSELERYATEQLLTEMAGSVLLDRFARGWSGAPPSAALRDRAIAVISQSRADPELTPEVVARAVQSSLRRVQAAFAEVDNSVAAEIRRQRARLAKSLLSNSRFDVLSVSAIAEQSGFGTVTSMRRALIDAYGVGPRELRANRGRAHASS